MQMVTTISLKEIGFQPGLQCQLPRKCCFFHIVEVLAGDLMVLKMLEDNNFVFLHADFSAVH